MNTFATNVSAAEAVAQYEIRQRVHDAERRAQLRAVRAARRAARHESRPLTPESSHHLPWWTLRFLSPVR
jgi:hypothetical protein